MKTEEVQIEDDEFLIPFKVKLKDLEDIIEGLCQAGGYEPFVHNEAKTEFIENPVTKAKFAWRRVRDYAINPVIEKDLEQKKAELTPREIIVKGS